MNFDIIWMINDIKLVSVCMYIWLNLIVIICEFGWFKVRYNIYCLFRLVSFLGKFIEFFLNE